MFYEKTTTVFERRKQKKKIFAVVLVLTMVAAMGSTAFAAQYGPAYFDAGTVSKYFVTTNSITKTTSSVWESIFCQATMSFSPYQSDRYLMATSMSSSGVEMGDASRIPYDTSYGHYVDTNLNYNTVHLKIANPHSGTNMVCNGQFWGNAGA